MAQFVEKPTQAKADEYCREGYRWNSGLVVARADVLIEVLSKYVPKVLDACRRALDQSPSNGNEVLLQKEAYETSPAISFDYAVLEHHDQVAVVNLEVDWSDVGS